MYLKKLFTIFIALPVFIISCTSKTSTNSAKDSTTVQNVSSPNSTGLKTIDELKMTLLDAKLDKVTDLFGEPDDKGENGYASMGHYIYYDKVDDGGKVKHLVIFWSKNRNDPASYPTIKKVEAVSNGGHADYGVYGSILIQKPFSSNKANNTDLNETNLIDTNSDKSNPTVFNKPDREIKYYRDNNAKIRLIKEVYPISGGDYQITRYYFNDKEKLQMVIEEDNQHSLFTKKSYITNDKVVKYIVQNVEKPCGESDNCSYDEFSAPYVLIKEFYK